MDRGLIVEHLKKRKKIVILTFLLLLFAFLENYYLNCSKTYSFPGCELGWIYVVLALIVVLVAYVYRK